MRWRSTGSAADLMSSGVTKSRPDVKAMARAMRLGSKWTLYGLVYSLAMVIGGAFFLRRHGNSRYQRIRTATADLIAAFLAPRPEAS